MKQGKRFGLSAEQKSDVWRRWKAGQTLHFLFQPVHVTEHIIGPKSSVNAESLTTPAVSRVFLSFFFCFSLNSRTLHRRRTNCVFFCCFRSSVSP